MFYVQGGGWGGDVRRIYLESDTSTHAHAYENSPSRQVKSQARRWDPRILPGTGPFGCSDVVGGVVKKQAGKKQRSQFRSVNRKDRETFQTLKLT